MMNHLCHGLNIVTMTYKDNYNRHNIKPDITLINAFLDLMKHDFLPAIVFKMNKTNKVS